MRQLRRKVFYVFVYSKKAETRRQITNRFNNGEIRIPGINGYEVRIRSKKSLNDLRKEIETAARFYILVDAAMPEDEKKNLYDSLCAVCQNQTVSLKAVNLCRQDALLVS